MHVRTEVDILSRRRKMATALEIEATNAELRGIYGTLMDSYLNTLYYGKRANASSRFNTICQVICLIGSSGAVGAVFSGFDRISALVAAVAAVAAAIPMALGLSDRIKALERLHFAYGEVFHLAKSLAGDIRRAGCVSAAHVASASLLANLCSRQGPLDELNVDGKLRSECQAITERRFPGLEFWYASCDGTTEGKSTEANPSTVS
jgi:hypothetical protein